MRKPKKCKYKSKYNTQNRDVMLVGDRRTGEVLSFETDTFVEYWEKITDPVKKREFVVTLKGVLDNGFSTDERIPGIISKYMSDPTFVKEYGEYMEMDHEEVGEREFDLLMEDDSDWIEFC
jgi:hypothetical protein